MKVSTVLIMALLLQGSGYAQTGGGKTVVYPPSPGSPGPTVFSHRLHGPGGAGYACGRCHEGEQNRIAAASGPVRGKSFCSGCHDGLTTGPGKQSPASPMQDCASCHAPEADIEIRLNRMDPVLFSHGKHMGVDAPGTTEEPSGFSCGDCHPGPFPKGAGGRIEMDLPHAEGGCARCHNGRSRNDGLPTAFPADIRCLTCHKMPEPDARRLSR